MRQAFLSTRPISLLCSTESGYLRLAGLAPWVIAAGLGTGATVSAQAQASSVSPLSLNAQLLVSAREGNVAQVARLLDQGAAVNSRNRLGKTPLLMACEKGSTELAEAALKAGADVNLASVEGVTPLMAASYGGHAVLARRLLAAGARTAPLDRMTG